MKIDFINKTSDSDRLILIFPGWSCRKDLFLDLSFHGWDIALVNDYSTPGLDITSISSYSTVYLFAWSLGVAFASTVDFKDKITAAVALNGTLQAADDNYGIPERIFIKTADNLSLLNLKKFQKRMVGDADIYQRHFNYDVSEEVINILKDQLYYILETCKLNRPNRLPWKKVFLSLNDAIFPYANMMEFWLKQKKETDFEIIPLERNHFVPFDEILKYSIPDTLKISSRFSNAANSYDKQAHAQKRIAYMLADLLEESGMMDNLKILEIGCGTGLFTREILTRFKPSEIDFVDLSSARPETGKTKARFFQADAEKWINDCNDTYDAVLSSATVQWFVNLPLFLENSSKRLSDTGIIGFSTFLPGNLHELDDLRPSPIHYHSVEEIKNMMDPLFDDIKILSDEITLEFDSVSSLFRHLRETGVGGSAPESKLSLSKIRNLRQLTFKYACFVAIKSTNQ